MNPNGLRSGFSRTKPAYLFPFPMGDIDSGDEHVSSLADTSKAGSVGSLPTIVSLCNISDPSSVFRGIWAVVIDSIKRKPVFPEGDVVAIERFKRLSPSLAYGYSSPSVVVIPLVDGVIATLHHRIMNGVKRVVSASRNIRVLGSFFVALGGLFALPAAAGNNFSASDVFTRNSMSISTVTNTVPHCTGLALRTPIRAQCNEPSETLSSDINVQLLGGGGRHGVFLIGKGMSGLYHGADAPEYKFWMPAEDVYVGSQAIQFSGRLSIND